MKQGNRDCIFLHCLPRGSEVTDEVFFGKQNFWGLKTSKQSLLRLNETAIIFQQYNLIPCLNVIENIEFQARINKKYDRGYIKKIIEDLRLNRLLKFDYYFFSISILSFYLKTKFLSLNFNFSFFESY